MKIVRFSQNDHAPRLGCFMGEDRVVDLAASCAAYLHGRGVVRAAPIAAALFPQSTRGFLEGGVVTQDMLSQMVAATKAGKFEPVSHPTGAARLHAPITDPGKLICIGLNYRDHAEEAKLQIPVEPPVFAKWPNAILDPGEPILRPKGCTQLDYEVELAVVMGRTCKDMEPAQALDCVYGYTILHDVSARDFQFRTSQWGAGKICDTFAPMGPFIADKTEVPDPHVLSINAWVNGAQMQKGNTKDFIFDVRVVVSYLSKHMTLDPGDVIATGTPAGVGFARKPPIFLQPGDTVRMEITGLGVLENPVKDA